MSTKTKAPDISQWEQLFKIMDSFKIQKPWSLLWDLELIEIRIPGKEDPYYCSVMGRNGECYGIGIYNGQVEISSFFQMAGADESYGEALLYMQNGLLCFWGNRDELSEKERKIIKDCGLTYRGANSWPHFKNYKTGFVPWYITSDEANTLIAVLGQLYNGVEDLRQGKIKVDFERGETILRQNDKITHLWRTEKTRIPLPVPPMVNYYDITDEILLANLKDIKKNKAILEMDLFYMNFPVNDKRVSRPFYPQMCMIMDNKSGAVTVQHMLDLTDDQQDVVIGMLAEYIHKYGRPSSLILRDVEMVGRLEDLCLKVGIEIKVNRRLKQIDTFIEAMMDRFL